MPDLTMCQPINCAKSKECYRCRAEPSQYQSYAELYNVCNENNNYQLFYEIGDKKVKEVDDNA